jgi:hypothetical protein
MTTRTACFEDSFEPMWSIINGSTSAQDYRYSVLTLTFDSMAFPSTRSWKSWWRVRIRRIMGFGNWRRTRIIGWRCRSLTSDGQRFAKLRTSCVKCRFPSRGEFYEGPLWTKLFSLMLTRFASKTVPFGSVWLFTVHFCVFTFTFIQNIAVLFHFTCSPYSSLSLSDRSLSGVSLIYLFNLIWR